MTSTSFELLNAPLQRFEHVSLENVRAEPSRTANTPNIESDNARKFCVTIECIHAWSSRETSEDLGFSSILGAMFRPHVP